MLPARQIAPGLWRLDVLPREKGLSGQRRSNSSAPCGPSFPRPASPARPPAFVDQQASLAAHLPWALAILALTTCTLIFLFTGSVVLPLKSLVMNVLTLGASFGILVRRVRMGPRPPGLESTQPILLCATAFGLSTDYAIFLFSRIKEARDRGLENRDAVADGLERTGRRRHGRGAPVLRRDRRRSRRPGSRSSRSSGVGTAVAVALDATIIRALLVPSLMALLGAWNWWAPEPLRRLHVRLGLADARIPPRAARRRRAAA